MSTHKVIQVTIRPAAAGDSAEIRRLATIDSSRVPGGPLLVAEVDGELQAALAISDGRVIADPFVETSGLVALLRERSRTPARRHRGRLSRLAPAGRAGR